MIISITVIITLMIYRDMEFLLLPNPSVCVCVRACVILLTILIQVLLYKTLSATYSLMGFRRKAAMMVHYAALQSFKLCQNYSHPQALYQVIYQ